jgi:hypothetical protein
MIQIDAIAFGERIGNGWMFFRFVVLCFIPLLARCEWRIIFGGPGDAGGASSSAGVA